MSALVGLGLTLKGPDRGIFGPDDYTGVFIGAGLLSAAGTCVIAALIVMGIGWYVQHPQPPAPLPPRAHPGSHGDPNEPFMGGRH